MPDELPEGRVLFRWTPTEADRVTKYDDIAAEYAVIENPTAASGIVVYAKWSDGWQANPWSERALVRHLLQRLEEGACLLREGQEIVRHLLAEAEKQP